MNTKPIAPMLAVPMSKADIRDWNDWVMEEKFDGWRLVVEITSNGNVTAWTRERKHSGVGGKSQNTYDLPTHLVADLKAMRPRSGCIVLDGELLVRLPDGRVGTSTDVNRTDLKHRQFFTAFDILMTPAGSCMMFPYSQRRDLLTNLLMHFEDLESVVASDARECEDPAQVAGFCHEVWDRGGEGLILKHKGARYEAGKRREAFVKIKKLFTAVCKVTGFEATRGTVMNRGAFAKVTLEVVAPAQEHPQTLGHVTSVKTLDDAELKAFEDAWVPFKTQTPQTHHPALGRLLRIEYQDIAADGGLRHPRWDRWEDQ